MGGTESGLKALGQPNVRAFSVGLCALTRTCVTSAKVSARHAPEPALFHAAPLGAACFAPERNLF
jgi:hypothetical protein